MLDENFFFIENIDATVIAQQPKLAPYIEAMCKNIADCLELPVNRVNVKATTEEKTGIYRRGTWNQRTGSLSVGNSWKL